MRIGTAGAETEDSFGRDAVGFNVVALVVAVGFVLLVGRLAHVQLLSAPTYRDISTGNRVRVIETQAPRGRILDTEGRVLAGSRTSYTVTMDWEALVDLTPTDRRDVFGIVADELGIEGHDADPEDIEAIFDRARTQALQPVVLAEDVAARLWISLTERDLPGITVEARPVRTYPYGMAAAHAIGYLGTVQDDDEAETLNRMDPTHRYRAGSEIGRAGLERIFERRLRGTPEIRHVEVDSRNRVVRTIEVIQAAEPGVDVHLTLDIDLQRTAERALQEQLTEIAQSSDTPAPAGSFVALDPTDGAVLALASFPGFDPTEFVFGLEGVAAQELFSDPNEPFLNRAVNGLYPAGSTFKPVPAYAAITTGARGQFEQWNDRGSYRLSGCRTTAATKGCVFRNARDVVMGPVDVREALTRSSDTYFYSLGELFWLEQDRYGAEVMQEAAIRFGLGQPTGIELPGEAAGRVPGPSQRQQDHDQYPLAFPDPGWYTGDNVNLSIGQGDLLVTPLQLANLYATLAAEGHRYQPRLVDRLADGSTGETVMTFSPRLVDDEPLDADASDAIIDGLLAVPRTGTAMAAFDGFDHDRFPLAAKTGTAEVNGKADMALFAGFGPWPAPRYAFAVVLEEAGFGGVAAAPVARQFFDWVVADPEHNGTEGRR